MQIAKGKMNCRKDLIYLILAVIETRAYRTPFFFIPEENELIETLILFLILKEKDFYLEYDRPEWHPDLFFEHLASSKQLSVDAEILKQTYYEIKTQGVEHYEFTAIDIMGTEEPES